MNRCLVFAPVMSGYTSLAAESPVGILTPMPTERLPEVNRSGGRPHARPLIDTSPSPRPCWAARAASPPVVGLGILHDAATIGMPALAENLSVKLCVIVKS